MKKLYIYLLLGAMCSLYPCTTFIITKGASADGSMFVGHSDDNELGDDRIVYVPAKDHPAGSKRLIYAFGTKYPRLVAPNVADAYAVGGPESKVLGSIDEIEHTYAYFDGNYGIMNEHQLAIGECTNATYFYQDPDPGKRIMGISELSHIALERCMQAKEAVILIGALAEKYGYYDFGETLLLADKEEAWVFEITSTPDGTSALWVAKKVPDGEIFVAANQFRIRDISPNDLDILFSSNLFSVAEKQHWWNPQSKKPLDWLKCVCPGEFDHPYYSLRRVWRVFSKVNPSLKLSPWVEDAFTRAYPFSIPPEKKLTLQDALALYRDHYEGTPFDQSKGLAAGPYGLTSRYLGNYDITDFPNQRKEPLKGAWERPISVYYIGFTYVNQIRADLPDPIGGISWIGFDTPYNCCFMPFYVGVMNLPECVQSGNPQEYNEQFIFWPFNIASNWISLFQQVALSDLVAQQKDIEQNQFSIQKQMDEKALAIYASDPDRVSQLLSDFCSDNAQNVMHQWWNFTHFLMEKYNAGFINKPQISQKMGSPEKWRKQVGYTNGPINYRKK